MKITPKKIIHYMRNVHKIGRPFKYSVALLLQAMGVSKYLLIDKQTYSIRFSPGSALARSLWVWPQGCRREEQFVTSYLKRGDTLVDVGANIGTITLAAASQVGASGCVISIEPHPRTFQYLVQNGALNNFTSIQYYNLAVGASEGVGQFSDKGDDDQNRVIEKGGIEVRLTTLDSLLREIGVARIELLKIDVEGYEKHVLEGATETLGKTQCVHIETLEHNLSAYGTSLSELLFVLRTHGFDLYRVNHQTQEVVAIRDLKDFRARTGTMNLTAVS